MGSFHWHMPILMCVTIKYPWYSTTHSVEHEAYIERSFIIHDIRCISFFFPYPTDTVNLLWSSIKNAAWVKCTWLHHIVPWTYIPQSIMHHMVESTVTCKEMLHYFAHVHVWIFIYCQTWQYVIRYLLVYMRCVLESFPRWYILFIMLQAH